MIKVKRTRFTIDLPDDMHRKIKSISAHNGKSMREIITGYLEDALQSKSMDSRQTSDEDDVFKGSITMTS